MWLHVSEMGSGGSSSPRSVSIGGVVHAFIRRHRDAEGIVALQRVSGHASPKITMVYVRVTTERLRNTSSRSPPSGVAFAIEAKTGTCGEQHIARVREQAV